MPSLKSSSSSRPSRAWLGRRRTGPAVPVPTLSAIGDDRLILTFNWQGDPLIDTGFPGFVTPPRSILLRHSVALHHSSLAEIKLQPNTPGTGLTGVAWILATVTASQAVLTLVGFDAGKGAVALVSPKLLGIFPYPIPKNIKSWQRRLLRTNPPSLSGWQPRRSTTYFSLQPIGSPPC